MFSIFIEKQIDNNNMCQNRAHRIEMPSTKDKSKATNESNLPGDSANAPDASFKPMNKITIISRTIQDEKHTKPLFATSGQYF